MGRAGLPLSRLVEIGEASCAQRPQPHRRGRPPKCSEGLVLALGGFQQLPGLSWRKLESASRQAPARVPGPAPSTIG
ncbi:MAG TPA: hypothetical protein VNL95_01835 [Dehalococcoidia bacterium]|nr:hypothetical protein [Dehalococcoidia bacterium]